MNLLLLSTDCVLNDFDCQNVEVIEIVDREKYLGKKMISEMLHTYKITDKFTQFAI